MTCKHCGSPISPYDDVCPSCGMLIQHDWTCPNCGNINPDTENYCSYCNQPRNNSYIPPQDPGFNPYNNYNNGGVNTQESNNNLYWIIGLVVVGITALALLAYFWWTIAKDNKDSKTTTNKVATQENTNNSNQGSGNVTNNTGNSNPSGNNNYNNSGSSNGYNSTGNNNYNGSGSSNGYNSSGSNGSGSSNGYNSSGNNNYNSSGSSGSSYNKFNSSDQYSNSGNSSGSNGDYIIPKSATTSLSEADLVNLSEDELCLARNEISARRGRRFDTDWIQEYFNGKSWYNGIYDPDTFDSMSDSLLTPLEAQNMETIKAYEQKMGYL